MKKEQTETTKENDAPKIDVKDFLRRCGGADKESVLLRERFEAVAKQYGRKVTINSGKLDHNIPESQLENMIALVK